MSVITLGDKKFIKYISESEIVSAINNIAEKINIEYRDEIPVVVVTLNGAIFFAVDLMQRLTMDIIVSCVRVNSYSGTETTNSIENLIGLKEDVAGKRVLILEDIVDTGNTYQYLYDMLVARGAKDIAIATMTFKPDAYKKALPVHYPALSIPPKFVVGHGLDYDGLGRNYKDIYQIIEEK
ncbi:hypoxanthine phosphoribosyltransferase [Bacteroidales bacterium OttesenSCG-928-B11]|nr:hypoxanthine phosphoribosyltransferase [Bacteroidales bacterium OttesenSCG-928-C03]MDL2311805.1 hypoxanthine phosphoribosyltransferase [Bacteroidales bacterium OttesenSCG-928-B11]MDL2326190.1 hypoxanthine phosphoribosyltransferase [Bacteroidales bacterium OttesenSCG-928-A14]